MLLLSIMNHKRLYIVLTLLAVALCVSLYAYISNINFYGLNQSASVVLPIKPNSAHTELTLLKCGSTTYNVLTQGCCNDKVYDSTINECCPSCRVNSTSAIFTRDLTVGSSGDDVAELQNFLISKGFLFMPPGMAVGYFGELTKTALAKFQKANRITETGGYGYFGLKTREVVIGMYNGDLEITNCLSRLSKIVPIGTCNTIDNSVIDLSFNPDDDGNVSESYTLDPIKYTEDVFLYNFSAKALRGNVSINNLEYSVLATQDNRAYLSDFFTEFTHIYYKVNHNGDWSIPKIVELPDYTSRSAPDMTIIFRDLDIKLAKDDLIEIALVGVIEGYNSIPNFTSGSGMTVTGVNVKYIDSRGSVENSVELKNTKGGTITFGGKINFDINQDGKIDLKDILVVAKHIDRNSYSVFVDFNSDKVVDIKDLAMIRAKSDDSQFDFYLNGKIDIEDVNAVAKKINEARYSAYVDLNSDGMVDVKDLAMIRAKSDDSQFDFYLNGKIDIKDVNAVAEKINEARYSAYVDLNSDGMVDVKDLAMIRAKSDDSQFDLNRDDKIDTEDFDILQGYIVRKTYSAFVDLNSDKVVDVKDLSLLRVKIK
jgi:peptidoglycan hydrolase-like protein with peptidoglycan-binding domain/uncharacterized protein YdbL (DUF1318 family)